MKPVLAFALALSACAAAAQGTAHQHGGAKLQVAVDGNALELTLESPLDNLIGFERGPRNDKERKAVRAMAQRFHAPAGLFVPTREAQCKPGESELSSAVIEAGLLAASAPTAAAAADPAPAAAADPDGHADLDTTVRFHCDNPAALRGIEVRLFKAFPGMRRIDAQVVSGRGQRAARLTAKQPLLAW